jgi:hypothetical protein
MQKGPPDRSRINMDKPAEVRAWSKHLAVSVEGLKLAVEKVGSSASAVRKELAKPESP